MSKILYMLIGPKGAGKTYIGTLVGRCTDIAFIRVEPIWLALAPGEDGWKKVEGVLDETFRTRDKVMIESLGAGEGFRGFHAALAAKYLIKMIRVFADLDTCLRRVQTRSRADLIPVSDEKVVEYNKVASQVVYDWAFELDNTAPLNDGEILAAFGRIPVQ
ncbi:MAG: shikimate kinase [Planctomycetota bacterium]|nr:shikimate kinase [Planctomycetota bacterium]